MTVKYELLSLFYLYLYGSAKVKLSGVSRLRSSPTVFKPSFFSIY